jgi:hypothetical protein
MRSLFATLLLALFCAASASAQAPTMPAAPAQASGDEAEVRAVIDRLFDGMRAGDSTVVASVFRPSATLATAGRTPSGAASYSESGIDRFIQAVGTPRDEVWDERIWDVEVAVSGAMATAWVPYAFYLVGSSGARMSHCGVNSVQLFRGEGGWQIVRLMDTRQRETCDTFVPEAIQRGQ